MPMTSIQTRCPACQQASRVEPNDQGQVVSCTRCGRPFRISRHILIPCPSCRRPLRGRPELIGQHVVCKHCSHGFRAVPEGDSLMAPSSPWPPPEDPAPRGIVEELVPPMTSRDGEVQPLPAGVADREAGGIPTGERDRHRDQVQAPQGRATEVGPPTAELGTARAEADHLRANLREVREPLAALQAAGSLAEEIEALRADRDRLEGEAQGLRAQLTVYRSEQDRRERSLAEAEGRHEAAEEALSR